MSTTQQLSFEESKLAELKAEIVDISREDAKFSDGFYLLMWLKETKFDIPMTIQRIRESKKWRLENGVDDISKVEINADINAAFPARYDGRTKDGYLVVSYASGVTDYCGVAKKYGLDKYFETWRNVQAKLELDVLRVNREQNSGKPMSADSVQGFTIVVDAKDFSIRQLQNARLISTFLGWMRDTVTHYPGMISALIFVNVGTVFKIVLKLLVPILQTANRTVEVYGTDEAILNEKVYSRINRNQILLCEDV